MSASRSAGRPRSEASRAAILRATFDLLVARGYPGLTLDEVALASCSAKTTIYRWWSGKAELAVDAFLDGTRAELKLGSSGDARADFRAQILELGRLLAGPRGRALSGMLFGARADPALMQALAQRWLEPRQRWGAERMARAEREGQLRQGVTPSTALAVLYSPVYAPLLFGKAPPSPRMLARILDVAADGIFERDHGKRRRIR